MIEIRGVVAGYGGNVILRDVTLAAPAGRVTALIGANGAGKTTLLRVASGLLAPRAGSVLVDGVDVSRRAPHRRVAAGICHIPEGRAIFPSLTVAENLALHQRDRDDTALERVVDVFPQLRERLGHTAGQLSGGQQQMVALARAYVSNPAYVLLDEVSMGLAPGLVSEIFDTLAQLAQRGCGVLVVEQYVQKALALADVVYVLKKGTVAFAGAPSEVDADSLADEYLGHGAPSTQGADA